MKNLRVENVGLILWIVGVLIILFATLAFDTSVQVDTPKSDFIEFPDRVINLQRVYQQLLLTLIGMSLFVPGVVIHAFALMLKIQNPIINSSTEPPSGKSHLGDKIINPDTVPLSEQMDDELSNQELMEKFNIKAEGDHFVFESCRYEKLADAVSCALDRIK